MNFDWDEGFGVHLSPCFGSPRTVPNIIGQCLCEYKSYGEYQRALRQGLPMCIATIS